MTLCAPPDRESLPISADSRISYTIDSSKEAIPSPFGTYIFTLTFGLSAWPIYYHLRENRLFTTADGLTPLVAHAPDVPGPVRRRAYDLARRVVRGLE